MVSVSLIWQLWYVKKGPDVLAKPPYQRRACQCGVCCSVVANNPNTGITSEATQLAVVSCPDCGANGACNADSGEPSTGNDDFALTGTCVCNTGWTGTANREF